MRHLFLALSFVAAPAFAADLTQAHLAALERLDCFKENPLIDDADDLVVLAIVPDFARFTHEHGGGPVYEFGDGALGRVVESDLIPLDAEVTSVKLRPSVLRVGPPVARSRVGAKRAFARLLDELRLLIPDVRLSCVYDLERWARARLCEARF